MNHKTLAACLFLLGLPASAQTLESLLPDDAVPGYGSPFTVIAARRALAPGATVWGLNGVTLAPSLALEGGYDSAPNGAAGASVLNAAPSLALADPIAGFGAYAAGQAALYPGDSGQNTQNLALAAGERAQLAREAVTVSAAYLRGAVTGFALETIATPRPVAYALTDFRVSDAWEDGATTLTPEVVVRLFRFPAVAEQDRRDTRETLTLTTPGDGILSGVLRLRATQSVYSEGVYNSGTQLALAGLEDKADGLWTVQLLAGAARRETVQGTPLTAPVLEAEADWAPDRLTQIRLGLAREIDDPDEISATPYTLSEARLLVRHGAPGGVVLTAKVEAQYAAYLRSPQRETLFLAQLGAAWPLSPYLALNTAYDFNNRQDNRLGPAQEHVVTLGVTWTP